MGCVCVPKGQESHRQGKSPGQCYIAYPNFFEKLLGQDTMAGASEIDVPLSSHFKFPTMAVFFCFQANLQLRGVTVIIRENEQRSLYAVGQEAQWLLT